MACSDKAAVAATVAALILLAALASAAPQLSGCSTGDAIIDFVGLGLVTSANMTTGGAGIAPVVGTKDCVWAGANINSAWYTECMKTFKVSVNNCQVTMVPSKQVNDAGCPCFWFDVRFAGEVSAPGYATITMQKPLATVAAARQLISWANVNFQAYSACFLEESALSDAEDDIVKMDRLPAVLATLNKLLASTTSKLPAPFPGKSPMPSPGKGSSDASKLTLSKSGDSVYLGSGACSFKFRVLSGLLL